MTSRDLQAPLAGQLGLCPQSDPGLQVEEGRQGEGVGEEDLALRTTDT